MTAHITVEVVFATPQRQVLARLTVAEGTTARQAVLMSGLTEQFPDLESDTVALGIWGERLVDPAKRVLHEGERVEVLRALLCDPKTRRRTKGARPRK